ncbi:DUF1287 domain-containing protein, partial [Flavobacterium sp.]|uniref:DUF1287 domain-containing protein n=1 Tax=Flavobacterium sp. TaxID=239 RepID=UPI003752E315
MKVLYLILFSLSFFTYSYNTNKEKQTETTEKTFEEKLSDAAISIIDTNIQYDSSYFAIKYPNGDVPKNKGVCTDVIIRTYRNLSIDLQKEVH